MCRKFYIISEEARPGPHRLGFFPVKLPPGEGSHLPENPLGLPLHAAGIDDLPVVDVEVEENLEQLAKNRLPKRSNPVPAEDAAQSSKRAREQLYDASALLGRIPNQRPALPPLVLRRSDGLKGGHEIVEADRRPRFRSPSTCVR